MVLSMTVVVIMSKEDDERNKAVEAVVAAGLGGLGIGLGLLAMKAIGDTAKAENARSNGGNVVRHHAPHAPRGPASNNNDGECDYDCTGWPYQQCKVTKKFKYGGSAFATCISPYVSRSSYQMFSNYPTCENIPSECKRCDDVCSSRDDGLDYRYDYTTTGPVYGTSLPGPAPPLPAPTCSEDNGRRMCCSFYGDYEDCSAYTGPDPTPWKRPREFTSCQYSDGYLGCEFIHECSKRDGQMFCRYDDYFKAYTGPDPHDRLCQYDDGFPVCY